jgi:hypothetical protein
MVVVSESVLVTDSTVCSSDVAVAALQQQALDDLLKSKDLQSLLVLLLGLYTRQLHKMHGGKPAAVSQETPALTDGRSSRQQRPRQQQQQGEQQRLLVPAFHEQLLGQYGISEQSLAGSRLDDAVSQDPLPTRTYMVATVQVLQLVLGLSPKQYRAQHNSAVNSAGRAISIGSSINSSLSIRTSIGGSSSSSKKVTWPTEMLTAVLQTTIEAQVRSMQHNWTTCGCV